MTARSARRTYFQRHTDVIMLTQLAQLGDAAQVRAELGQLVGPGARAEGWRVLPVD